MRPFILLCLMATPVYADTAEPTALEVLEAARKIKPEDVQMIDASTLSLEELMAQADAADWVLVHDAARPCLRPGDVAQLLQRCRETGEGGILAQPVVDTVKQAAAI